MLIGCVCAYTYNIVVSHYIYTTLYSSPPPNMFKLVQYEPEPVGNAFFIIAFGVITVMTVLSFRVWN